MNDELIEEVKNYLNDKLGLTSFLIVIDASGIDDIGRDHCGLYTVSGTHTPLTTQLGLAQFAKAAIEDTIRRRKRHGSR